MQRRYRGGDTGLGGGGGGGGGRQSTEAVVVRGGVWATTFASLRYRDFTFLWLGQITHAFALWIDQIAKPLFILHLGGGPLELGLILLTRTLPAVIFGMVAGVVADNFNRRTVLIATKVGVFILSVGFTAVILLGIAEMWHIFAYNALRGMTMAFDQPARRAMIPTIVPHNLVTNAMALSTGSMTAMRICGAAMAGILVAATGFGVTYGIMTAIYLVAILFTWMLRPADHQRSGYQGVKRMGGDFLDGFRYAWRVPDIRGILIISLGWFMFGMVFMQVFAPLIAHDVLTVDRDGTGINRLVNWLADPPGAVDRSEAGADAGDNTGTEVVPAEGEADADSDKPKPVKGAKLPGRHAVRCCHRQHYRRARFGLDQPIASPRADHDRAAIRLRLAPHRILRLHIHPVGPSGVGGGDLPWSWTGGLLPVDQRGSRREGGRDHARPSAGCAGARQGGFDGRGIRRRRPG